MSYAFYNREFNSKAVYRMRRSHVTLIVPAPVSANRLQPSVMRPYQRSGQGRHNSIADSERRREQGNRRPPSQAWSEGILAVLRTWANNLTYHPHVHMLVTGGGVDISYQKMSQRNPISSSLFSDQSAEPQMSPIVNPSGKGSSGSIM